MTIYGQKFTCIKVQPYLTEMYWFKMTVLEAPSRVIRSTERHSLKFLDVFSSNFKPWASVLSFALTSRINPMSPWSRWCELNSSLLLLSFRSRRASVSVGSCWPGSSWLLTWCSGRVSGSIATVSPAKQLAAILIQSGSHKLIDAVDEAMTGPSRSRPWDVALRYPNILVLNLFLALIPWNGCWFPSTFLLHHEHSQQLLQACWQTQHRHLHKVNRKAIAQICFGVARQCKNSLLGCQQLAKISH